MNEYARKGTNRARFFIGGEPANASASALDSVVSLFAKDDSAAGTVSGDPVTPDFGVWGGNGGRPECPQRASTGFWCGDDRIASDRVVIPMGHRADQRRNVQDIADSSSTATGHTGQRDPIAVYRTELLCRLLEPIRPAAWGGRPVLWPLWADEMVHRTYVMVHLTALLIAKLRFDSDDSVRPELDYQVASNLAAAIGELVVVHDNERLPCSAVLRGIARNFIELFGPIAGDISIATRIEPLRLAAFKRRALVLVAIELISQALVNGFHGLDKGHIEVQLARISFSRARLTVTTSDGGQPAYVPLLHQTTGKDLANLLEAEIVYENQGLDGAIAQIDFGI
jgi:two-component sensor histidine kinase